MKDFLHLMIVAVGVLLLSPIVKDASSGWLILFGLTAVTGLKTIGRRFVPVWAKQARRIVRH